MFRFLTAGESHGRGLVAILEGIPAGLAVGEEDIAVDLKRRQGGYGRGGRMKIEQDRAEIISGVRHGLTMGSPIALLVWNKDFENWAQKMRVAPVEGPVDPVTELRPGHADLAGTAKYHLDDIRPILERASARETTMRVAVGAVARKLLAEFGIQIRSHVTAIGGCWADVDDDVDWEKVESSPVRCGDIEAEAEMMAAIDEAQEQGDSLGGTFEVVATGVPAGLGSHVQWDRRINGKIAQAIMSIQAVKGVEIGTGFAVADLKGSCAHDVIEPGFTRPTNMAGGIEGGITNGEPIKVAAAIKPIATIPNALPSIDLRTGEPVLAHVERADTCVVPAAAVIGEAMLALVLAEAMLEKFGGDHVSETLRNYQGYIAALKQQRGQ